MPNFPLVSDFSRRSIQTLPVPSAPNFLFFAVITALAAVASFFAGRDAPFLYDLLEKPAWAPPSWVFGPAWTALYAMMTIAIWNAVRDKNRRDATPAVWLYCAQLVANAIWTYFVGLLQVDAAMAGIVILWVLLLALWLQLNGERMSRMLLLPYVLSVSFAVPLTWAVWQANPALL